MTGTWSTFSARIRGDFPLHIVLEDEELWKSELVPLPGLSMLAEVYDAEHAAVMPRILSMCSERLTRGAHGIVTRSVLDNVFSRGATKSHSQSLCM